MIVKHLWQAHYQNVANRIHRIKCKYIHDDKKCETCGIKYKYCDCFLEYTNFEDDLIEYKVLLCNKNCQRQFDEKLKEHFLIHTLFLTTTIITFFFLLWKGVYSYEYIDDREKFNETSLPEKEDLYSHLKMGDITYADYMHAKIVCKILKWKI